MKIIHTSDWHIGKMVNGVYMTDDQAFVLEGLIALLRKEQPDALLIAGDLYDRSVPPVEAVELLDKVLNTIVLDLGIPVIAVAGNHDSPDRLSFGSRLMQAKGLHMVGRFAAAIPKVTLQDATGPVDFHLVPYASPAIVRDCLDNGDIHTHDDAMRATIDTIRNDCDFSRRNIIVTHGFITGTELPELCESEKRLTVGGTDNVSASYFQDFCYTALGHLHGPQKVGSDKVRYAGSLLKYSFSEVNHTKSVTVVELDKNGQASIDFAPLVPRRDMRKIKGEIKSLLDPAIHRGTSVEDYLHVTLTDQGELYDPANKLRAVYPNILALARETEEQTEVVAMTIGESYRHKTKLALFQDFYAEITTREFTADKADLMTKIIQEAEQDERGGLI